MTVAQRAPARDGRRRGSGRSAVAPDATSALARFVETRDPEAMAEVVEAHLGLAQWAAARFTGRGEQLDDLVQVARIGLFKAVQRFDPARGPAFAPYAVSTMLGELKRHLRDRSWSIRPPRGVHDRYLRVRAAVDELTQERGASPTIPEIAARARMSNDDVVEASDAAGLFRHQSLDDRVGGDDSLDGGAFLGAGDEGFDAVERRADLAPLLARLKPKARTALHLRFVEDLTQSDIAGYLGVSQMQVSRILSESLQRLRSWCDVPAS